MDRKDVADRDYEDRVADNFVELWKKHSNENIFPGRYGPEESVRIVRREPQLAQKYLPLINKTNAFADCLALLDRAPHYANRLFGVFEEREDLLHIYASLASGLQRYDTESDNDEQLGHTRISISQEPKVVQHHIESMKVIYGKLNEILGAKESVIIARPFEGLAEVYLIRLDPSSEDAGGIILRIFSKRGDFVIQERKIYGSGIIESRSDQSKIDDIGYLLKDNYELDEEKFFEALTQYPPMSEPLNTALEESGATKNDHGRFAKTVFGEK